MARRKEWSQSNVLLLETNVLLFVRSIRQGKFEVHLETLYQSLMYNIFSQQIRWLRIESLGVMWTRTRKTSKRIWNEHSPRKRTRGYEKRHEDNLKFQTDFLNDVKKLHAAFPNNPFEMQNLTITNKIDVEFEEKIY